MGRKLREDRGFIAHSLRNAQGRKGIQQAMVVVVGEAVHNAAAVRRQRMCMRYNLQA